MLKFKHAFLGSTWLTPPGLVDLMLCQRIADRSRATTLPEWLLWFSTLAPAPGKR